MKLEQGSLLLITLLAVGTVMYTQVGQFPTTNSTAQSQAVQSEMPTADQTRKDTDSYPCYRDVYSLVGGFFGLDHEMPAPPDLIKFAKGRGYTLAFLLATVPDPVDSRVGWRYDLILDAMQRALEASGYIPDWFSLPWECAAKPDKTNPTKPLYRPHERNPGVILFRGGPRDLLVLFLVGETPTSGVHKAAFANALSYMEACPDWNHQVRLVGPSFSGSIPSLGIAIQEWWMREEKKRGNHSQLHFRIISGSATNPKNREILKQSVSDEQVVDFRATVVPDNIALAKFMEYLCDLDSDPRVAILQESNTGYGRGLQTAIEEEEEGKKKREKENATQECRQTPEKKPWLVLPFPMHISQVRSAYEKDQSLKDRHPPSVNSMGDLSRLSLELSLDEIGNPRDVLPALTPSMTAAAVEQVLANILSTISREGIEYVGLLATDTRDKLFLARQIRKHCPDVRLFTLESDILYTHPDYRSYLEGMIVVSTYPLFNKNQVWSYPFQGPERRLQFPIHGAQGTYNATLALINYDADGNLLNTSQNPMDPTSDLVEYTPPFDLPAGSSPSKPPLWLTVIGRGGLWPLRYYSDYQDQEYVFQTSRPAQNLNVPWPFSKTRFSFSAILVFLLSLFCLAHCLAFWAAVDGAADKGTQCGNPSPGRPRWREVFWLRPDAQHRRERGLWLLVCFLTLLILYAALGALYLIPRVIELDARFGSHPSSWDWLRVIAITANFFILLLTTLAIVVRLVDAERNLIRNPSKPVWKWYARRVLLSLVPLIVSILLGYLLITQRILPKLEQAMLLYERFTNIASGVSPVLPVVLLGVGLYLWSLCHLRRLHLLQTPAGLNQLPCGGDKECQDDIERVLTHPLTSGSKLVCFLTVLALVFIPCWVFIRRLLPTYEGEVFDWSFILALILFYLGIVLAFLQFGLLWHRFRRLLRRLAAHPMVEAYDRLPLGFSRTHGDQFWARLPTDEDKDYAGQLLNLVARHYNEVDIRSRLKLPRETNLPPKIEKEEELVKALDQVWEKRALELQKATEPHKPELCPPDKPTIEFYTRALIDQSVQVWVRLAEDYMAINVVGYISQVFVHLRNLLTFVTAGALLLLFIFTSYPLQPQRLVTIWIWAVILLIILGSLFVFIQAGRDEVLSRIAKTPPNRVTFDRTFISMVLTYGLLPLLGLLATLFPEAVGLFSWVEPVLRTFK